MAIMNTQQCILQWNCQGIRNKKDELLYYVETFGIDIIALQETMQNLNYYTNLQGYNLEHCDGHFNRTAHGGVGLYIHQDLPYERVELNTTIQAVAIRTRLSSLITICNVYFSRSHTLNLELLNDLYEQLPQPVLMLGDFNAYNTSWGSAVDDSRGLTVESFCNQNLLNTQ